MADGIKRIGVLTGGGDCPGLNAVIRAVVKSAILDYDYEVIGFEDGFKGLVENSFRQMGVASVAGILPKGGTILGTTNRDNPFAYPVTLDGKLVKQNMSSRVLSNLEALKVDALVVIGGDGSLSIANEMAQLGVKVIGVPKTIDNDLSATDFTFGFNTAVATATDAIDKLHTTAESHHRVMVLEVMGRYAGWIALESGIAGGADIILIPEIPYNIQSVCNKVNERYAAGKKFSIVVVAEGAHQAGEGMVVKYTVAESHDPIRLGGIGNKVGADIERLTGSEARVTVLGHLQRGGIPTPFDRILGTRLGVAAVKSIAEGRFGTMVSLQTPNIVNVPLTDAIHELKKVPVDGDMIAAARSIGICLGD